MRSAFDCALDLRRDLDEGGITVSGWHLHSHDAEISKEGLLVIQRHIERIIREARASIQQNPSHQREE